jgi:p-aminobenzoyl-glutamate transporter AbgT
LARVRHVYCFFGGKTRPIRGCKLAREQVAIKLIPKQTKIIQVTKKINYWFNAGNYRMLTKLIHNIYTKIIKPHERINNSCYSSEKRFI